ncbi:MAG: FxsA family protein [Magnetococcus sp. YQC-5]
MNRFLLLVFIVIPLLEIQMFLWMGGLFGIGYVLLSLLGSALLGVFVIRREGMRTLMIMRDRISRGEIPGEEMLDGAMLVLAGVLLILPGYLSDLIGLILLLPWTRTLVRHWVLSYMEGKIRAAAFHGDPAGMVIEGETLRRERDDY